MNIILHWKKAFLCNAIKIYSAEGVIGQLKEYNWKQTAEGEINKQKFKYRTSGFFNQVTEIIVPSTNYIVGKIEYNTWRSRATLTYLDQKFFWQYDNLWQTKWSITNDHGLRIAFEGSLGKGSIEGEDISEFLVLAGLFVTNYFIKTSIVIFVAIFVPIIASISR